MSAPQILLVEEFSDREGIVLLLDFGKMHLTNGPAAAADVDRDEPPSLSDDADDEADLFMTPCSTPPGSPLSPCEVGAGGAGVDAGQLQRRVYDTYSVRLSEMQVLCGRARDNWQFAHTKSTSALHLLDRFSILLQAERRVLSTSDPVFPGAALRGTLPQLVVHLSEPKLAAVCALWRRLLPVRYAQHSSVLIYRRGQLIRDRRKSRKKYEVIGTRRLILLI